MKKYVKSGYDDYDPDDPLSWDEFATLQEISELEDDIESDISQDLSDVIIDKCEEWCNELGLDYYNLASFDFNTYKTIDKLCDELASKIYNAYINK